MVQFLKGPHLFKCGFNCRPDRVDPFCSAAYKKAAQFAAWLFLWQCFHSLWGHSVKALLDMSQKHTHKLAYSMIQTILLLNAWIRLAGWGWGQIDGCLGSVSIMQQVSNAVLEAMTCMHTLPHTHSNRLNKIQHPHSDDLLSINRMSSAHDIATTNWRKTSRVNLKISVLSVMWWADTTVHFLKGLQSVLIHLAMHDGKGCLMVDVKVHHFG